MVAQASLGTVYLVGAGPGDPDLLTVRAHRLLCTCDALVYDALVPTQLLALPSPDCHKVFVGKRRGRHSVPQQSTNRVLARLAHTHQVIVRLKGGDPFVFGRGAEEAAYLHGLGIPVQVTPGITAGIAVPAYIGLPVTHREAGSSITFVTGHELVNKGRRKVNWHALATATDTMVIYMGIHSLAAIVAQLLAGGLDAATPAAAIQQGTTALQRHVIGPIVALPQLVRESGLQAPAIVVVGCVVDQRIPACAPPLPKADMPIPLPDSTMMTHTQVLQGQDSPWKE